jgi:hypothetical protein
MSATNEQQAPANEPEAKPRYPGSSGLPFGHGIKISDQAIAEVEAKATAEAAAEVSHETGETIEDAPGGDV